MESSTLEASDRTSRRVMMLVIVAAVLLTFGRLCRYEFISWDDEPFIARYTRIADPSWENLWYHWRHAYFTIYIPVTTTVWQLLALVGRNSQPDAAGIGLNPYVFHAANVVAHLTSSVIVFSLLCRLLKKPWVACAGALVFALHPVQVETVAWVSGLKDLLAGLGSLAAMLLYLMAWDDSTSAKRRRWLYAASTLVLLLAMLSKPSAFTTPAVMFAIDAWLLRHPWRRVVLRLLPWFLVSAAIAGLARLIQPPITGMSDLGYVAYTPIVQRPLIVGHTLAFYFHQVIWPAKLALDYGHLPPLVLQSHWSHWAWIVPAAVLGVAASCRSRVPMTAAAIFVLAIFHVLGWVPFDTQFFSTTADHYLYVAMLGVALLVGWLFTHLRPRTGMVCAVVLAAALGIRSFVQAGTWRDTRSVFEHNVAVNPNSWLGHCNLAQLAIDEKDWNTAVEHCQRAIEAQPRYVRSYTLLGTVLAMQNDVEGAQRAYAEAVTILPDDPVARTYLGGVQASLGDWIAAEKSLRAALALNPSYEPALLNYGTLLLTRGNAAAAEPYLQRAVQQAPGDAKARFNLARCLENRGRRPEAVAQLQIAYTLQPTNPAIAGLLQALGAGPSTTMPVR